MMDSALKLKNGVMQVLSEGGTVSEEQFDTCIKNFLSTKVKKAIKIFQ